MKTLYLSIITTVLFSFNAFAQPTFNMNDIGFQVGDVIDLDSCEYVDMSTMTGPNMIWDFSELVFGNIIISTEMLAIEDVESPLTFEGANMVRELSVEGFQFYQYFSSNANDVQFHGYFSEYAGTFTTSQFNNSQQLFTTPMTYGSTGEDTYSAAVSSLGSEGEFTGSSSYEIVGYGTLLVNGETHNDVLLMHLQTDDTTVSTFGGMAFETNSVDDAYLFFKAGYHFPLLTFSHLTTDGGVFGMEEDYSGTILLQQVTTGVDHVESIDFQLFPNPVTNNEITIQFSEPISSDLRISLFDIMGKEHPVVIDDLVYGNNNINLSLPTNLASGIYQVLVRGDEIQSSRKIIIE